MANKRIRIAAAEAGPYYTLPGNTGEKREELANVGDTIFGQRFESNNPTLAQWNVTANGIFKGLAGYKAIVRGPGTPTAMTDEAMTLVSGKTYVVTSTAKRMLSLMHTLTVEDNGVDHTADVLNVDYLAGTVTFKPAYAVTGPVTISGGYIPMAPLAKARSFTITQTAGEIDASTYVDAQASDGYRVFEQGLLTGNLEIGAIKAVSSQFVQLLRDRAIVYVEIDLDTSNPGKVVIRGFYRISGHTQGGNQGDLESETIPLSLYAPDGDLIYQPFGYYIANDSTLNPGIKLAVNSWLNGDQVWIEYLEDGTNGVRGPAVVLEATLANAVDGQNEFSFNFRGRGEPVVVP